MQTLPPEFQQVVDVLRANRMTLIAAYSLYYWDLLALFPIEYRYVWKAKMTPTKVFYLLKLCGCITTIRVWAIYNHDKRILASLSIVLTACGVIMVYFSTQQNSLLLPPFLAEAAGFTNCLSTQTNSKVVFETILWTPPLVFDTVVLCLTIFRYFQIRHHTGGIEIPILRKIVNKHILYFALITTLNIINVAFFSQKDPTLKPSNAVFTLTLTSIMSARLVLSLLTPAPPPFVKSSKLAMNPMSPTRL
ncbi:hypothetical protein JCM5350_006086 [Sporobolomyces pararoseus]